VVAAMGMSLLVSASVQVGATVTLKAGITPTR
jgi:hypothetical protein